MAKPKGLFLSQKPPVNIYPKQTVVLLRAVSEWGQSGDDSHLGRTIVRIPKTPAQVGMD